MSQSLVLLVSLGIICVAGVFDSRGFFHAAKVWESGQLAWPEVAKAALGFNLGFVAYLSSLKYLKEFGVISAEVQTLAWFVVTLVGLALLSGSFLKWTTTDQVVAVGVLGGLGWLLINVH